MFVKNFHAQAAFCSPIEQVATGKLLLLFLPPNWMATGAEQSGTCRLSVDLLEFVLFGFLQSVNLHGFLCSCHTRSLPCI